MLPRKDLGGLPVFIGSDDAELRAVDVAEYSLHKHATRSPVRARRLSMRTLQSRYTRPTSTMANGQLWDDISGAPMSTSHAIARFFVPMLCDYSGWALFTDGDVLFRDDVHLLFALAQPQYAVMVVQHPPLLEEGQKKAGHIQQAYPRKNWSSVMLFNCGHLANRQLKTGLLNSWPGRDLHAFKWLGEHEIGALPSRWNYLVGVNPSDPNPAVVHYTLGTPDLQGHQQDAFAQEWLTASRVSGYRDTHVSFHAEIG